MVGGDSALLAELIDAFLDEAPGLLSAMQAALASGDVPSLRRAAHTLKSNSQTFGAIRLGNACQAIEERAAQSANEDISTLVELVLAEYPMVEAALEAERSES